MITVDPLAIFMARLIAVGDVDITVSIRYADKLSKEYNARLSKTFKKDDEYKLDSKLKHFESVVHRHIGKHQDD